MITGLLETANFARALEDVFILGKKGTLLEETCSKVFRHNISKTSPLYKRFLRGAKDPNVVINIGRENKEIKSLGFQFMDGTEQAFSRGALDIQESRIGYDLLYMNPSARTETAACNGFFNPMAETSRIDKAMFGWDRPNWVADTKGTRFGCRLAVSMDAVKHFFRNIGNAINGSTVCAVSGKSLPKNIMESVEKSLRDGNIKTISV